jgi:protein involved in polysaccharide export with SLBB domain
MRGKTGLQMPVERTSMARNLADASKPADALTVPPSEKYKVGVGDVLFVDLKNSPQGSGYYTVRRDGTIDYPLAGENVLVADQTAGFVAEMLAAGITLFPNPRVEVKVREYVSHQITVSGMVERPGNKVIQREAVPLYVIRAEAGVDVMAMKVSVKRTPDAKAETYDLRKPDTDNILIYAGNSVEFTSENGSSRNNVNGFFFISGEVVSAGQKEFISNLTLYQAVIAAGGVKGNPKKATIRRKNDKAVLSASDYNLRSIKEGKAVDPALFAGDIIEIRN